MATPKRRQGCIRASKGENHMELMIGAVGVMAMMLTSLAFQKASYKKVTVTVQK